MHRIITFIEDRKGFYYFKCTLIVQNKKYMYSKRCADKRGPICLLCLLYPPIESLFQGYLQLFSPLHQYLFFIRYPATQSRIAERFPPLVYFTNDEDIILRLH